MYCYIGASVDGRCPSGVSALQMKFSLSLSPYRNVNVHNFTKYVPGAGCFDVLGRRSEFEVTPLVFV